MVVGHNKSALLLMAVILFSPIAWARSPEQLEDTIDFDASLRTVAQAVRAGAIDQLDRERYFMIEGSVASITFFDPTPESFQAVVELVSGDWEGLDSITVSRIYVLLEGPEFAARLPARLPSNPGDEIIQVNQELLVIGRFVGTAQLEDEELGVIQGVRVR